MRHIQMVFPSRHTAPAKHTQTHTHAHQQTHSLKYINSAVCSYFNNIHDLWLSLNSFYTPKKKNQSH